MIVSPPACDHLFIGMVGNIGSGVSTTANELESILKSTYGYEVVRVSVSSFIESSPIGPTDQDPKLTLDSRVDHFQTLGNKLRSRYGNDVLAKKCVIQVLEDALTPPRIAYIFDSLKHPDEVRLLRRCFEERLMVMAVFCPARVRKERLLSQGYSAETINKIFERDEFEIEKHGQKVRDTAYLGDFFIRNAEPNRNRLRQTISRYLEILFSTKVHTPTFDEAGMSRAFDASVGSACLSRQVGAAVYSAEGKLLATGCNDVPKFGGGLYTELPTPEMDHRCYNWKNGQCRNDQQKNLMYNEIIDAVVPDRFRKSDSRIRAEIIDKLRETRVKDLIEFSRSVHAEMDAIVSVARHGNGSILGGTLFSKTFPCHNCARHIVASGIKKVVYVEPYPKSLALRLHEDSITVREEESSKAVLFIQYEGVSPRIFQRFFGSDTSRKYDGKVRQIDPLKSRPSGMPESRSYLDEARSLSVIKAFARPASSGQTRGSSSGVA